MKSGVIYALPRAALRC